MTFTHHPTDETLAAFAAGHLDEGRALVVATHAALCRQCRQAVRGFEHAGGVLLNDIEPAPMRADAWPRALERIGPPEAARDDAIRLPGEGAGVPKPLQAYELGPWRWIGRGVQWRPVPVPANEDRRVFMLKAAPGTRLPHHRHTGTEWTCVLQGAFRHDFGRYGPGDFDEADETVEHRPFVEHGDPCICLVALQGRVEFQGWIGRLLQPLVRI